MTSRKRESLIFFLIFIFVTILSLAIRFHDYENAINFHLDPPQYLHEVKDMVDQGKLRLIGSMVTSKVVEGRWFFIGPTFYYLLAILGVVLNWNVVLMTAFFAFIWIIFFVLVFLWLKDKFGILISLLIYILLSFFPSFVPFSRIIWNPTFVPLFAFLLIFFLEKRREGKLFYLLAGLSFGLGLSFEYVFLMLLPVFVYYLVREWRNRSFKILNWLLVLTGFILGEAPLILFELKHNFYNLQTILFQLKHYQPTQTYNFDFKGHFYYYVFPFLPLFCLFYAKFLRKIQEKFGKKIVISSQVLIATLFLIRLIFFPRGEALINPEGWTIRRQQLVADLIVDDSRGNFEVAALVGPETRANELRWWLRMKNSKPLGVEDYEKTDILYLVAPLGRPPEKETVWEVRVLRPFEIVWQKDLGERIYLYKLVRQKKEPVLK